MTIGKTARQAPRSGGQRSTARTAAPKGRKWTGQARDAVLAAADTLFYRQGVGAVGVDAVAKEAGFTKRSLYYHFPSKEALVSAYLEARDGTTRTALTDFATARGPLPGDRIAGAFDYLERWFGRGDYHGCPFINAVAEQGEVAAAVGPIAQHHKRAVEQWLRDQAQLGGASDPQGLGAQLMLLIDGALVGAMVGRSPAPARAARAAAMALLAAHGVPVSPPQVQGR